MEWTFTDNVGIERPQALYPIMLPGDMLTFPELRRGYWTCKKWGLLAWRASSWVHIILGPWWHKVESPTRSELNEKGMLSVSRTKGRDLICRTYPQSCEEPLVFTICVLLLEQLLDRLFRILPLWWLLESIWGHRPLQTLELQCVSCREEMRVVDDLSCSMVNTVSK